MIQLPIRFDFISGLMFFGILQAFGLVMILLNKENRKIKSNVYLALMILSSSVIQIDLILSYTGLMQYVIFLNDFSEPLNYTIAPFLYLHILSKLEINEPKLKRHFYLAGFYFFYHFLAMIQPDSFKLNNYIEAYFPALQQIEDHVYWHPDPLKFTQILNELMICQFIFYLILAAKKLFFTDAIQVKQDVLHWLKSSFLWFLFFTILVIATKLYFVNDLGDYILSVAISIIFYSLSFNLIRKREITQNDPKKYQSSNLSDDQKEDIVNKINAFKLNSKEFLETDFSLQKFSTVLKVSSHHLSRVLNEEFKMTFFDFLAFYRIEEAKKLLVDPNNYKIDDIAERVGYSSKSAFNATFKKITGKTPSEFKKDPQ
jgi:AraC-like DNA-binding protein